MSYPGKSHASRATPNQFGPAGMLVLVHSPLVGPLTWRATAARLGELGVDAVVVDLRCASDHAGIAARVAAASPPDATHPIITQPIITQPIITQPIITQPIILVGHSGAGRHLPALAEAVRAAGLIYVDAALPAPGRSWFDDAPPELAARLRELAGPDGRLPPWPDWFGRQAIAELLPDPVLRERVRQECPRMPLTYFAEAVPVPDWAGPQVYLRLSEAYLTEAERMRAAGTPVLVRASHHLAMLTDPEMIAEALLACVAA